MSSFTGIFFNFPSYLKYQYLFLKSVATIGAYIYGMLLIAQVYSVPAATVVALYTTCMTVTLVGLPLESIFMFRLAH